jgi:hypothetical protein
MKPASKDDITPQEYWRLRYAAFLCAIFDVLSTLVAEGAFCPPQFAQQLKARRSGLLDDIIKSSSVSPLVSAWNPFLMICKRLPRQDSSSDIATALTQTRPVRAINDSGILCFNLVYRWTGYMGLSSRQRTEVLTTDATSLPRPAIRLPSTPGSRTR